MLCRHVRPCLGVEGLHKHQHQHRPSLALWCFFRLIISKQSTKYKRGASSLFLLSRRFFSSDAHHITSQRFLLSTNPNTILQVQGPAIWTKGEAAILGGNFRDNVASVAGGIVFASEESSVTLASGVFEGNRAIDGGVAFMHPGGSLAVEGGVYSGNVAADAGGAFYASEDGNIKVRSTETDQSVYSRL